MRSLHTSVALTLMLIPMGLGAALPNLDASLGTNGNRLELHWKSTPGQAQWIQVSTDLVHWTNLPPLFFSAFTNSAWSDDGSLTGPIGDAEEERFYRLRLVPSNNAFAGVPLTFLPASTGSAYSWNFGDGTSSTGASPTHAYLFDGVYTLTAVVTDEASRHTNVGTVQMETAARVLLTPAVLDAVRLKAATNTAQWQAFKKRLDGQLTSVIESGGAYQGDELSWIGDYALGYKTLQFQDPVTAGKYADKALALMKSALHDFQKFGEYGQQYLARGDGTTKVFLLPNSNIVASSLRVYKAPVSALPVTRANSGSQTDNVDSYLTYIKVSNTPDGPADYQEGTDWVHNGDLPNYLIDWSPAQPGHRPAPGATYYVTVASSLDASSTAATLSGNTITLSSAPKTNEAIYVEYVYGVHAPDYSTLAFQQSSAGDGGLNSIMIDDGFPSRYLGKFTAMGYDWLYGYPGFAAALKNETASMLVRWSDYWRDNEYRADNPASNYGEGGYISRILTALALGGSRNENGSRLLDEIINYRQTKVLPLLTNSSTSLSGGFWAEGWNYGQQATRNLVLSGLALEAAGLGTALAERQWAGQVIYSLISEQPTKATIYDGGDWYDYPAPFVSKDLLYTLAVATTDPTAGAYANYVIQTYPGGQIQDMQDLLFRDPNAPAAFWSSFPLAYFSEGTGLINARADWSYNSTWLSFQLGNELDTDHQTYAQGHLEVQRGGDALLINPNALGGNQTPSTESSFGNLLTVDDNGAGTQTYRFNQGFWFGTPGCRILNYETTPGYVYALGDYAAAYGLNTTPGIGTAKVLTRQIVYQRPDYIVVHDRAVTGSTNDLKQLRWHFLNNPSLNAGSNSWVATEGSSKLFGQTFSRSALISSNQAVTCPAGSSTLVYRLTTQNASKATNVTYTTALQSAPATETNMVSTTRISSADHRMEGVQMGAYLVLFGADGPLIPFSGSLTYTVTGTSTVIHLLTD
ncbi:MAG TPA: PKD domain-containing protein, partial [Verrucomicrobiae bacterium]|nr:PKD domain-containing protein [Verrucomicrobiae bacterium]